MRYPIDRQTFGAAMLLANLRLKQHRLDWRDVGAAPSWRGGRAEGCTDRALVDDAKLRTPRAGDWLSDKSVTIFLRKQGCSPEKYKRGDTETRGWKFPRLAEMRQAWAKRYGGWNWAAPEQEDWK